MRVIGLILIACLLPTYLWAASCCGGGSSSSLVLAKVGKNMIDVSIDHEEYHGYWDSSGEYHPDPQGSDLKQYRLNLGLAHRFGSNWQGSVGLPWVYNDNQYANQHSKTSGLGDMSLGFWYEHFDQVTCVSEVESLEDLKPSIYTGLSLTLPTGTSPYDDVDSSFDIIGRGFYRLDALLIVEKTVYPWNMGLNASYGTHRSRPVNQEYGTYVEPYQKKLGDRQNLSASVGYTIFLENLDTLTLTLAHSYLHEDGYSIDGKVNQDSAIEKRSWGLTSVYASMMKDWTYRFGISQAQQQDGQGKNFPVTTILTLGVGYVLY